jgi:hypothetical protein
MALELDPNQVFRDFVTDRIPSSGAWNPRKVEIRALLTEWWQTLIALAGDKGGLELPNLLISMTVTGGDENAIVAEANLPVPSGPGIALFSIDIEEPNTGPVTINGKPLLSNGGKPLAPGALSKDGIYLFLDNGASYRLLSDYTSASIIAAAEAAAEQAEAAKGAAESAAGANLSNADSRASAIATSYPSGVSYIRTAGYARAGDGGGALYRLVSLEPRHAGKFRSADGKWWEIVADALDVRAFGAKADGFTESGPQINAALQCASAIDATKVCVRGGGTFVSSELIIVPEGIHLCGDGEAEIKQADGAELTSFIGLRHRSKVLDCVVNGNAENNLAADQSALIRIGDYDHTEIKECRVYGAAGYCVVANAGQHATVHHNTFHDFYCYAVAVYGQNQLASHVLTDNYIYNVGWGGFIIGNVEHVLVARNTLVGALVGGRNARMTVDTSGNTITWASGPNFSSARRGQFFVLNNGMEFRITDVTSATQVTVLETLPTLTDTQASFGTGDMIGVIACQFVVVEENAVINCATFGMGACLGGNSVQCSNNVFRNNNIRYAGKNAINISYDEGTGFLSGNRVEGNSIFNAGCAGGIGELGRVAIMISSTASGKVANTYVGENSITSFDGEGQTTHWLGCNTMIGAGCIKTGDVVLEGTPNAIMNAIESISLSSGWGSGATISSIEYGVNHTDFNVIAAGSGFGADPMVSVVRRVVPAKGGSTGFIAKIIYLAGGATSWHIAQEFSAHPGHQRACLLGTPFAGHVYRVRFLC